MRTELFNSKMFFYIFLIIVGLALVNSLILVSKPTTSTGIIILKYLNLTICILALLMFFIKTKFNHSVLKLFIYFIGFLVPFFLMFRGLQMILFYRVNPFSTEVYATNCLSIFFAVILLLFYNKFKNEIC